MKKSAQQKSGAIVIVSGYAETTKESAVHQPMETEVVPTPARMLKEFNEKFEVTSYIEEKDAWARDKFWELRMKLISEEFKEVMDELLDAKNGSGSMMNLAKELADLKYVIYQAEALLDIPSDIVFAEVHRSNMSKLGDDGRPVRRSDGKILKGPNYHEPDLIKAFGVSD
jgi:predicted HAD superfamily Cof-like phosphohydrolase